MHFFGSVCHNILFSDGIYLFYEKTYQLSSATKPYLCPKKFQGKTHTLPNGRAKKSHLLDKNAISAQFFWVGTKSVYWHVP